MLNFIVFVTFVVIQSIDAAWPPPYELSCPDNEHYERDTGKCQITCDLIPIEPVMGPCQISSACFCNNGYVRKNDKGLCILREDCDPPRTPICPGNEIYEVKTTRCQIYCNDVPKGPCPPTSGCFCPRGYVRAPRIGVCIKRNECSQYPLCGKHEVYTDCFNLCIDDTCKERITGSDRVCTQECGKTGCICEEGYYRHDNGSCVTVDQCSPPDCPEGEVYNECGSACPATCENRGNTCMVCTAQCVEGCFCAPNTIRGPDGSCIAPRDCPPRICRGVNEIFVNCPPTCPPTQNCTNLWSSCDCSKAIKCCAPQCRCKKGYYRNKNNVCISERDCRKTYPTANANAYAYAEASGPNYASAQANAHAEAYST